MISNIVTHTNSYANEHIFLGTHQSYASSDGSWQDATADEIKRLAYFKSRCLALYQPRQNLAVDERMVKSRHRSGIRQYIKDKPTRWGIKLWVLADSSNGYTVDFNVYIGKEAGQNVSANGLGYDVVMKLIKRFVKQGYHLFLDNFYTSVTLFKDLYNQGVLATGTIMETRQDFPASLKKNKEWAKGKEKGKHALGKGLPLFGSSVG